MAHRSFVAPAGEVECYLRRVAEFGPEVVLYDVFSVHGLVAARALGVPSASLVTFPGYGALGDGFAEEHCRPHPALEPARAVYRALGADGLLPALFPSPDLSIVTAVESLSRPVLSLLGEQRCEYVGPCVGRSRIVLDGKGFPFHPLDSAKRSGRRIVLFSLGTVLTGFRSGTPVGGAPTGATYLAAMLDRMVTAFADRPEFLVVAAVGPDRPKVLWPANFVVADFVPQREVLARFADVFVTHNGMNSTAESVLAGVPMVSVPGVGDQLANAEIAVEAGAAVARWDLRDPYRTCTAELLGDAVRFAADDPSCRSACLRLRDQLLASRGPEHAAELLISLAR